MFNDKIGKLNGILSCYKINDDGTEEKLFEEKNLIVKSGVKLLIQFLMGDDVSPIRYMAFGDMNLSENDNLKNIRPPSIEDYKLENEVFRKPVEKEFFEDENYFGISFIATLEKNEANGITGEQILTEFGLLSESVYISEDEDKNQRNILFSRKTRSAIIKSYDLKLKFIWKILIEKNQKG